MIMEEKRESEVAEGKKQVAQEMDNLGEATTLLLSKLDTLDNRLKLICRDPNLLETTEDTPVDDRVLLASALGSFRGRVQKASWWIDSILERLEL